MRDIEIPNGIGAVGYTEADLPDPVPGTMKQQRLLATCPRPVDEPFHAGPRRSVDELAADGPDHGWTLLFPDRHPYAGGPGHYAAYLASTDNFEVELVAAEP